MAPLADLGVEQTIEDAECFCMVSSLVHLMWFALGDQVIALRSVCVVLGYSLDLVRRGSAAAKILVVPLAPILQWSVAEPGIICIGCSEGVVTLTRS